MDQTHKKRGRKIHWTPERVDKMCDSIRRGSSYKDAYTLAGVPKSTFYDHLVSDSDFLDRVKKAEADYQDWYDSELVVVGKRALMDLVQGYVQKTTKTKEKIVNGKTVKETITEEKQLPPNATAIIFALCNRDPEHWQNRVNNELSGKIATENTGSGISLANVPDTLLAQVIEAINKK